MAKQRTNIPKAVREKVLKYYHHRCAMCGEDQPVVHHLDEDPSNNDPLNLMPLCANCHTQQHNPTTALGAERLSFFRRYNHQAILKPQFRPLLKRMSFFDRVETASPEEIDRDIEELVELVAELEMGAFYAKQVQRILTKPPGPMMVILGDPVSERQFKADIRRRDEAYKALIIEKREEIKELLVELLDFQNWP